MSSVQCSFDRCDRRRQHRHRHDRLTGGLSCCVKRKPFRKYARKLRLLRVLSLGSRLKILSFSPNLERLVLRCIDSYDSESRLILKHFSRTTRSTILCTAQISKIQGKVVRFFRKNETFIFIFIFISAKFDEFCHFSTEF